MSGHKAMRAALRHTALCVAVLTMLSTNGCGSKSAPPAASTNSLDKELPNTTYPSREVANEPAEARASVYVGLNWNGPQAAHSSASASNSPLAAQSSARETPASELPASELPSAAAPLQQPLPAGMGNMVEVFYATDRLPTAQLMPSVWRTFAPVGVVWMICAALFIGFTAARRFSMCWLMGSGLAICLGLVVFHASLIRWQQYTRLAHNAETRFSSARDSLARDYPLHLGSARVSLPSIHKPGRFEQPKLYQFEFVETVGKHIVLHSLQTQDSSAAWFDELSHAAQRSDGRDSFVFVHGYNVRFIDALKRTAQLACDLDLAGPAICYSWPSRGDVAAYVADEASVAWSAPHFERLLLDLRARTQCERVHVVAHSMGNRALLQAIERIDAKLSAAANSNPGLKIIDRLVMAAPDVDLAEFATRYVQPLRNVTQHTTLYFSDNDRALLLSARLHGAPRLGLIRDHLQAFAGIESIYVGRQASLALGHSYYGDDPAVIEDLKALLRDGRSAASRELLTSATNAAGDAFWRIDRSLQAQLPVGQTR